MSTRDVLKKLEECMRDKVYDYPCGDMRLLQICHEYLKSYPVAKMQIIHVLDRHDKIAVSGVLRDFDYENDENDDIYGMMLSLN